MALRAPKLAGAGHHQVYRPQAYHLSFRSASNTPTHAHPRLCCAASTSTQPSSVSTRNGSVSYPALAPLDGEYESKHQFSNFANWIVPGVVLLGRYPHVEPSRCTTRDQGEAQLQQILEAGITTFVSLQEELPPQEEMKLAGKNGFLPYKATAELIRAALNGPPPMEIVDGLRNPTLDKFLPQRKRGSASNYNPVKLQFVHSPIVDLGIPTQEQLQKLVADLQERVAKGEKLYVHCWGGRGRAGTVGACLLTSMYNMGADEALQRVQRAFDTRKDDGRRSPETDEQHAFVRQFVSHRSA